MHRPLPSLQNNLVFYSLLGLTLLFGIIIRWWDLAGLSIQFDEVFIPKLGYGYLIDRQNYPFPNAHPTMGNNIYAAAIWLYHQLPWVEAVNFKQTPYKSLDPMSFRWISALIGSLVPVVIAWLAYLVSQNRLFTLLVAGLVVLEPAFIVDSRFALNNMMVLLFGFLAITLFWLALANSKTSRLWLASSGLMFGIAIAVKWNVLGLWAAMVGMVVLSYLLHYIGKKRQHSNSSFLLDQFSNRGTPFAQINAWEWLIYLAILPVAGYILAWLPDMLHNTRLGFWGTHEHIVTYHNSVSADDHPYCSPWYSWPLMLKPIAYYFEKVTLDSQLIFKDIHNFGIRYVYWISVTAMLAAAWYWIKHAITWYKTGQFHPHFALLSVIIMGYCANLLPWVFVSRCLFFYHYQPSLIFSLLAMSYFLVLGLKSPDKWYKWMAIGVVISVVAGWLWLAPLMFAIELTPEAFNQRMQLLRWFW